MTPRDARTKTGRLARGVMVMTAVSVSVAFHGALPLLGRLVPAPAAVSTIEMVTFSSPELLPVDDEDREGPAAEPEPEGPPEDSELAAASGDPEVSEPEPAAPAEAPPAPTETPAAEPPPARVTHRPRPRAPELKVVRELRRVENRRRLAARLAAARGKAAAKARQQKGKGGKGGGEAGGSARAAAKQGQPEAVYACAVDGLGKRVDVRFDRPVEDWVTVMPTVLMPFKTRPGMGPYLKGVSQIVSRRPSGIKRAGPVEFALPAEVLQMEVDSPRGVRVSLGRLDGRCLVGVKYTKQLFPLTISRVPIRVLDSGGRTADAIGTITLYKDASFDVVADEGELPFKSGRLKNADAIASTIQQHYGAAQAAKQVAGWFGFDLAKMAREKRLQKAKERSRQAKQGGSAAQRRRRR